MEQDIIEVPYSEGVPTQVITIDLPHPPSVSNGQQDVETITLYPQDAQSMTTLQQSNESANQLDCKQIELKNLNNNNDIIGNDDEEQQQHQLEESVNNSDETDENNTSNGSKSLTRFKWTKEKSQVAMNLVKHGCKPKLISVAVGCSLRTAQKFVETVTPKMEGESFKNYEIRRRGRKSKDVNQRLEAIREVLSKDSTKTQVEIAADLKVSNTTVCRDLKRIGASWKEKRNSDQTGAKRETKKERRSANEKQSSTNAKARGKQRKSLSSSSSPKKEFREPSETSTTSTSTTTNNTNPAPIINDNNH